ncbi:MAG: ATP-binding cassette domain-containing protein [Erysipelotrichales bacterium]
MRIILDDITKKFNNKVLFNKFNFLIEHGSFFVVYGESGSGKSTMLNILSKVIEPDNGSVRYFDKDNVELVCSTQKLRANYISYIFQNFALINEKSVYQNLEMVLKNERVRKKEKDKRIFNALAYFNIEDLIHNKVSTLSGGEQQRVALARSYLKRSDIIFADEPTGNLDKVNKGIVIDYLIKMNKLGKTIVVVTHDEAFRDVATDILEL